MASSFGPMEPAEIAKRLRRSGAGSLLQLWGHEKIEILDEAIYCGGLLLVSEEELVGFSLPRPSLSPGSLELELRNCVLPPKCWLCGKEATWGHLTSGPHSRRLKEGAANRPARVFSLLDSPACETPGLAADTSGGVRRPTAAPQKVWWVRPDGDHFLFFSAEGAVGKPSDWDVVQVTDTLSCICFTNGGQTFFAQRDGRSWKPSSLSPLEAVGFSKTIQVNDQRRPRTWWAAARGGTLTFLSEEGVPGEPEDWDTIRVTEELTCSYFASDSGPFFSRFEKGSWEPSSFSPFEAVRLRDLVTRRKRDLLIRAGATWNKVYSIPVADTHPGTFARELVEVVDDMPAGAEFRRLWLVVKSALGEESRACWKSLLLLAHPDKTRASGLLAPRRAEFVKTLLEDKRQDEAGKSAVF